MPENAPEAFDQWAVVELFGHQVIAGRVTEQTIGGATFVRVDVPATDQVPAFTKFYGASAIYAITPVSAKIAHAAADRLRSRPVDVYGLPAVTGPADRMSLIETGGRRRRDDDDD